MSSTRAVFCMCFFFFDIPKKKMLAEVCEARKADSHVDADSQRWGTYVDTANKHSESSPSIPAHKRPVCIERKRDKVHINCTKRESISRPLIQKRRSRISRPTSIGMQHYWTHEYTEDGTPKDWRWISLWWNIYRFYIGTVHYLARSTQYSRCWQLIAAHANFPEHLELS